MKKRFGKNDILFLCMILLLLAAGYILFFLVGREEGAVVEITVDGELYGTYSLKKNQTVDITTGEKTTNRMQINDGKADMIWADCPDKLCVHQKAISKERETIVCLPNKVVVEVIGGEENDLDSIT